MKHVENLHGKAQMAADAVRGPKILFPDRVKDYACDEFIPVLIGELDGRVTEFERRFAGHFLGMKLKYFEQTLSFFKI